MAVAQGPCARPAMQGPDSVQSQLCLAKCLLQDASTAGSPAETHTELKAGIPLTAMPPGP